MNVLVTQIPFTLNNKHGVIEVCYNENRDVTESGFDLLKGLGFDVNMCLGYPTIHAYFKNYEGTGYYKSSGWIQIINNKYYSSLEDTLPCKISCEVDIDDTMRKLKVPFFSYGFPAEIYDAPCNNLGDYSKSIWTAETFLVTYPSRINDNTISYILGFKWGYEEWSDGGERHVRMLPFEIISSSEWEYRLPMLRKDFDSLKFK
ncbi:MAG: hypothetical protein II005_05945 [Turicibacter sp.]|nr:hypothetical protein [Turicibacter sp.]